MLATHLDSWKSNFTVLNNKNKKKHRIDKIIAERVLYSAIWNIEWISTTSMSSKLWPLCQGTSGTLSLDWGYHNWLNNKNGCSALKKIAVKSVMQRNVPHSIVNRDVHIINVCICAQALQASWDDAESLQWANTENWWLFLTWYSAIAGW